MNTLIKLCIGILAVVSFVYILNVGLDRNEVVECTSWVNQIKNNGKPQLSGWEKAQCDAHNIASK